MIGWKQIEKLLKQGLGRSDVVTAGAKSYPALQMFKILLLQQWYGLSDKDTECAMLDRISFIRFAQLSLEESVPDHTTICRFRNLLVEKRLLEALLDEVNWQMEKQGKLVKKGVAVDASIISSAARPRKQVDVESVVRDRKEAKSSSADKTDASVRYSQHETGATADVCLWPPGVHLAFYLIIGNNSGWLSKIRNNFTRGTGGGVFPVS
jgi:IS5 family transposase